MASNASVVFYDAAGKPTGIHINTRQMSGAGFDALSTDVIALANALAAVSKSDQYTANMGNQTATGAPEDRGGLRGTKALIRWFSAGEGDGGQYGSNEIGAVDPDLFTVVGNKQILQGGLYDAIKAAFDAVAETENGNSVSVYEIELVSRSV